MGHVPGYSNNVGHTFGKTTQELFVDPSITHSEKLVLSDKYANDYKVFLFNPNEMCIFCNYVLYKFSPNNFLYPLSYMSPIWNL